MRPILLLAVLIHCLSPTFGQTDINEALKSNASFIANYGQWKDGSLFHFNTSNFQAVFLANKIRYTAYRSDSVTNLQNHTEARNPSNLPLAKSNIQAQVWEVSYPGSATEFDYTAAEQVKSVFGYLNENTKSQILYPDQFKKLRIRNLYPGIHADFFLHENQLKVDYLFEDASTLPKFQLHIEGFADCRIGPDGEILMTSAYGQISEKIPHSYYLNHGGLITSAKVHFRELALNTFGLLAMDFRADDEPSKSLIVDPFYLDFSTYFHGSGGTTATLGIELDEDGATFVTGWTSAKFPGKPGTYDTSYNNFDDGYLAKFSSSGNTLEFFIYIGGSNGDHGVGIHYSDSFGVYLSGNTNSKDFPVTSGVLHDTTGPNGPRGFILCIDPLGKNLIYSTYFWGESIDNHMKTDKSGNLVIATSIQNPYSETYNINPPGATGDIHDIGLFRLNKTGSAILDYVRIKGNDEEEVTDLFLDASDNVYITGHTSSSNLPVIAGANNFGSSFLGGSHPVYNTDGFYFVIDSSFTKIKNGKYIGTAGTDYLTSITSNNQGEVFLYGRTGTDALPKAKNKFKILNPPVFASTGFILKMNATGNYPSWLTYIYSATSNYDAEIHLNARGECYFTGFCEFGSLQTTADALQKNMGKNGNLFLGKISASGDIIYLSHFGGDGGLEQQNNCIRNYDCITKIAVCGRASGSILPLKNAWKSAIGPEYICKFSDTIPMDEIDFGLDKTFCDSFTLRLDAGNPGAKYLWSTGETTQTISISKPGIYFVEASYGCEVVRDTVKISLSETPKPMLTNDSTVCDSNVTFLDAQNNGLTGIKYHWNTGDSTQNIQVLKSGLYFVSMQTPGCPVVVDSIQLHMQKTPKIGIIENDTVLCLPFQLQLNIASDSNETHFRWSTTDSTPTIFATQAGTYAVQISNRCGMLKDSAVIHADSFPPDNIGCDSLLCNADSFSFTNVQISPLTTFTWLDAYTTVHRHFYTSGIWLFTLQNTCGLLSDSVVLTFDKSPQLAPIPDLLICDQDTAKIELNQAYTYTWSNGDTGKTFKTQVTGAQWVVAQNKCGFTTDTFLISQQFAPKIILNSDTILCNKNSFVIAPIVLQNADSLVWNNGSTDRNLTVSQTGKYTATATNKCASVLDTCIVTFMQNPIVNTPVDQHYCDSLPGNLSLTATIQDTSAKYQWDNGDPSLKRVIQIPGTYTFFATNPCGMGADSTTISLSISTDIDLGGDTTICPPLSKTLFVGQQWQTVYWSHNLEGFTPRVFLPATYTVWAIDSNGCTGRDTITFLNGCNSFFHVPNSFTPNGDGINDGFGPVFGDIYNLHFQVFNRWGQKLFESNESNPNWDGTYQGVSVPIGSYAWVATYKSNFESKKASGVFIILR